MQINTPSAGALAKKKKKDEFNDVYQLSEPTPTHH